MAEKIEILIADDHELVREGICKLVDMFENMTVISEAADGLQTVSMVRDHFPDLVLLDLNMPRMNGIDAIRKIKEISPNIKILILTIHEEEEYVYEVIKAGAEGFLQKDVKPDELKESILRVLQGDKVFPSRIEEEVEHKIHKTDEIEDLSDREQQVLELLARGMSNRELAEELYISEKTVKNHVSNILHKMNVNDRTQAVIMGLKKGMVKLS